jgi:hypothetical protein
MCRSTDECIGPAWCATEVMIKLDPKNYIQKSHPIVYIAAHLQLRQIAREKLRREFEENESG